MAGRLLGEAWIAVNPDTTRFGADARAKISAALKGFTPAVEVNVDGRGVASGVTAIKAKARAAADAGGAVNIKLGVDARGGLRTMADVRAMLKGMTDKAATLRFNIDEPGLLARATALNARLHAAMTAIKVDYEAGAKADAKAIANAHSLRKQLEDLLGDVGIDVELNNAKVTKGIAKARKEVSDLKASVKAINFDATDAGAVAVIRQLKAMVRDLTEKTYKIRTIADVQDFRDQVAKAAARAQAVNVKLNPVVAPPPPGPQLSSYASGIQQRLGDLASLRQALDNLHRLTGDSASFLKLQERLVALRAAVGAIASDPAAARAERQYAQLGDEILALSDKLKPLPASLQRGISDVRKEVTDLQAALQGFTGSVSTAADQLALQRLAHAAENLRAGMGDIRAPEGLEKARIAALALQVQFDKLRASLATPAVLHLDATTASVGLAKTLADVDALRERLATLSAHNVATGNAGQLREIRMMSQALADVQRRAAELHANGIFDAKDVTEAGDLAGALKRLSGSMDALDGGVDKSTRRWRGFINTLVDLTQVHIPLFNGALNKIRLPKFIAEASGLHILMEGVIELAAIWGPAIAGAVAFGLAVSSDVKGVVTQMMNIRTAFNATGQAAGNMGKIFNGQLAGALRPQVWTVLGEAITAADHSNGKFVTSMQKIGTVVVGLGQRLVDSLGNGDAFAKSAQDIQGLGDAFASLGRIISVLLKSVPGYAEMLLKLGNAILSITANVLSGIQPLIQWGLKIHGAIFYLGLFATLLGTVGKNLVGGFQTGFKAATAEVTAFGDASAGAAVKATALDAATMGAGGSAKGVTAAVKEADGKVAGFGAAIGGMAGNVASLKSRASGIELSMKGIGGAAKTAGKGILGWIGSLVGLGPVAGGIMLVAAAVGFVAYKMATAQTAAQKFTASLQDALGKAPVSEFASQISGNLVQVNQHLGQTSAQIQQWAKQWDQATGQGTTGAVSLSHAMAELNSTAKLLTNTGRGAASVQQQQRNVLITQARQLASDYAVYQAAAKQAGDDQGKFNTNLKLVTPIAGSAANAIAALTIAGVTNNQMLDTSKNNQKYLAGVVASVVAGYQAMTSGIGGANTALQTMNITTSSAYQSVQNLTSAYSTFLGIVTGSASAFTTFENQFLTIAQATGKAIPGASAATQAALNAATTATASTTQSTTSSSGTTASHTKGVRSGTSNTSTNSSSSSNRTGTSTSGGKSGGTSSSSGTTQSNTTGTSSSVTSGTSNTSSVSSHSGTSSSTTSSLTTPGNKAHKISISAKGKMTGAGSNPVAPSDMFGALSPGAMAAMQAFIQQLQAAQQLFAALQTQATVSGNSPLAQFSLGKAGKDIIAQLAAIPGIGKNKETTSMLGALATQTGFKGNVTDFQAIVKWAGSAAGAEADLNKQQQILTITSANLAADAAALSKTMNIQLSGAMAQAIFDAEGGQKAMTDFAKAITGVKDKAHPTSIEFMAMQKSGLTVAKMLLTMTGNAQAARQQFETFMAMQGMSVSVADQLWNSYNLGAQAIATVSKTITVTGLPAFETLRGKFQLTADKAQSLWDKLKSSNIITPSDTINAKLIPSVKTLHDKFNLTNTQAQALFTWLTKMDGKKVTANVDVNVSGSGTATATATLPPGLMVTANSPNGSIVKPNTNSVLNGTFTLKQAGGLMDVPGGWGGGDRIPAMLEPGELVVPKRAVPPFKHLAKRLGIPGFAGGGVVGQLGALPDVIGALGLNSAMPFAAATESQWAGAAGASWAQTAMNAMKQDLQQAAQQQAAAATGTGGMSFPGAPAAAGTSAAAAQSYAASILGLYGWGQNQMPPLTALWNQECLTLNATILTQRGWLAHDEVRPGDRTIGYNPASGRNEWTEITRVVRYENASVVRLGNSRWHADVTPGHRWWSDARENNGRGRVREWSGFTRTQDLTWRDRLRLTAPADTEGIPSLSLEDVAVLAWLQGDGSLQLVQRAGEAGEGPGYDGRIYQSKKAQVVRLRALLARTEYTEVVSPPRNRGRQEQPEHVFLLRRAYVTDIVKRSEIQETGPEAFVLRLSPAQRAAWLTAIIDAEGSQRDNHTVIYQNEGPLCDAIVLAAYLEGFRPTVHAPDAKARQIGLCSPHVAAGKLRAEELKPQPVWCVTTRLGTWTARQDGQLFLTGNSGWRWDALNASSGAYGIPQSLPADKMAAAGADWRTNPATQIRWGLGYIKGRYGSPAGAESHELAFHWYHDGGIAGGRMTPMLMDGGGMAPGSSLAAAAHFASGGKAPAKKAPSPPTAAANLAKARKAADKALAASRKALAGRNAASALIGHTLNASLARLPHLFGLGPHRTAAGVIAEQTVRAQGAETAYETAFSKYQDARSAYDALLPKPKVKPKPKIAAKGTKPGVTPGGLDLASLRAAFARHDMTAAQKHAWHLLHEKNTRKHSAGGIISEPVAGFGLRSGIPYSFAETRAEKVVPLSPGAVPGGQDSMAQVAALLHKQNQLLEKQNQLLAQQPQVLGKALAGAIGRGMYRS